MTDTEELSVDLSPQVEKNLREWASDNQLSAKEAASELVAIGLDEVTQS
jgi:hypothetical protein